MTSKDDLAERLRLLDVSVMSDVLDEAGLPDQVLAPVLRPLDPGRRLAGIALCAAGRAKARSATTFGNLSPYELERRMPAGGVLVLDTGADDGCAPVGGFMAATFKASGCAGLVVNGAVRDALELLELGLPTFIRSHSPANASRRWQLTEIDAPVSMPGARGTAVTVNPGDFILGDIDGLVVIPRQFAEQLIEDGERLQAIEQTIREEIQSGATREKAFAHHSRFSHIRPVAT